MYDFYRRGIENRHALKVLTNNDISIPDISLGVGVGESLNAHPIPIYYPQYNTIPLIQEIHSMSDIQYYGRGEQFTEKDFPEDALSYLGNALESY